MSRDKQIEEIKAIILEDCGSDCENCEFHNMRVCYDNYIANRLYNAGYRKSTEVAEEIFAEIEKILKTSEKYLYCNPSLSYVYEVIAELKKKYTEEGK